MLAIATRRGLCALTLLAAGLAGCSDAAETGVHDASAAADDAADATADDAADATADDAADATADAAADATAGAAADADAGPAHDVVDSDPGGPSDVDIEVLDGGSETPCGLDPTCARGEVCVVTCLCCGIDTGSPDDAATDHACVAPPAGCDGSPAECVANAEGCYANGDWLCESPCA